MRQNCNPNGTPIDALDLAGLWFIEPNIQMPPHMNIIAVVRDRFSTFPQCLEALYRNTDIPFRLVVVAGGADGKTEEYLAAFQRREKNMSLVLMDRLLMQGEARNIGLQHCDERFCVILENDTIVHENWLAPLLQCVQSRNAAAAMPLIWWHGRIHAAGCYFEEQSRGSSAALQHQISYTDIRQKRIDYPECHCIVLDRQQLPTTLFEDVEPFDVDLGLLLRKSQLRAFIEPASEVTYAAPPPWEVRDIPAFTFRWDPEAWEARNQLFMKKWGVDYDQARKLASYRRQQLKLGLARRYPNKLTIGMSNIAVRTMQNFLALVQPRDRPYSSS